MEGVSKGGGRKGRERGGGRGGMEGGGGVEGGRDGGRGRGGMLYDTMWGHIHQYAINMYTTQND